MDFVMDGLATGRALRCAFRSGVKPALEFFIPEFDCHYTKELVTLEK